jgi:hypothetical protein
MTIFYTIFWKTIPLEAIEQDEKEHQLREAMGRLDLSLEKNLVIISI